MSVVWNAKSAFVLNLIIRKTLNLRFKSTQTRHCGFGKEIFWGHFKLSVRPRVKARTTVGQQRGSLQNICLGVEKGEYF